MKHHNLQIIIRMHTIRIIVTKLLQNIDQCLVNFGTAIMCRKSIQAAL